MAVALVQRSGYLPYQLLNAPEYGDVSRLASQVALRAQFIGPLRGVKPCVFAMPVYEHVGSSPKFLFSVHVERMTRELDLSTWGRGLR